MLRPIILILALVLTATATAAEGGGEALPVLVIGDYHIGQGQTVVQTLCLLRAAGHDAFGAKVGLVHSNIVEEWEKGRGRAYIAGTCTDRWGKPVELDAAEQQKRIARYWEEAQAPAPERVVIDRTKDKRRVVRGTDREATRADKNKAKAYRSWQQALGRWFEARLQGVEPRVVVVACTTPRRRDDAEHYSQAIAGFKELIEQHGAKPIFAATARWQASTDAKKIATGLAAQQEQYRSWATDHSLVVAPINLAWSHALAATAAGELRFVGCRDHHGHYGETTAYLSACVLYAAITGTSPVGLPPLDGLDPRFADLGDAQPTATECTRMQEIAWQAWQETAGGQER